MALQKDYINESGQTIPNCYWKVGAEDGFTGGKEKLYCKIYCYENKTQADLNQNELYVFEVEFFYSVYGPENVLEQIYEEIKQHVFFEDAIDV